MLCDIKIIAHLFKVNLKVFGKTCDKIKYIRTYIQFVNSILHREWTQDTAYMDFLRWAIRTSQLELVRNEVIQHKAKAN